MCVPDRKHLLRKLSDAQIKTWSTATSELEGCVMYQVCRFTHPKREGQYLHTESIA